MAEPTRAGRRAPGQSRHLGVLESNLSGSGFEGLRVAKQLGLYVTFFTRDLDRYLRVPGAADYFSAYVDDIVHCETNELEHVLAAARPIHAAAPFAAFLTFGEYDVVVAAAAARELGLRAPDPTGVAVARNKLWMRQRCAAAGVPTPAFAGVASGQEAVAAAQRVGLPCVVKPTDETASADVARCRSLAEVDAHFASVVGKTANVRGQRRFPKILVEQALLGYEVSVEALAEGSRICVLGVTDKSLAGSDRYVEVGHVFPSLLPPDVVSACADVATAALRAVGFDLGMAHVEVKVTAAGPQLIEINARPAGGKITNLVDLALGISCLELVLRQYLGEPVLDELGPLRAAPARGAAVRFLTAAPGIVTAVTGVDTAAAMPGVLDAEITVAAGDTVRPLQRNVNRLGHVLAVADEPYLALRRAESALSEISVCTSPTAQTGTGRLGAASRPLDEYARPRAEAARLVAAAAAHDQEGLPCSVS